MGWRGAAPTGPVRLAEVELAHPLADLPPLWPVGGGRYAELHVLVRLHGHPLGMVNLPTDGGGGAVDGGLLALAIWDELAVRLAAHCHADGLAVPEKLLAEGLGHDGEMPCSWRSSLTTGTAPMASIVITTCGGPGSRLDSTVRDALSQSYPRFEVIVVDNRPATSGTRHALAVSFPSEPRLRYVAEPKPGLSHARNSGAAAAGGEVVAFTDDDVDIDAEWLGYLVAGFDHPGVACVTGLILPLELETGAQRLLEEFGGYAKGFARRTWDRGEHRLDGPLYPYTVGAFGSGANAAFLRGPLGEVGGFDGALGAGTLARGGEDIDIFVTCIERGFEIVYEPAAIIRHAHAREMGHVRGKVRDYGVGLGAMLTKHLVRDWPTFAAMIARLPLGLRYLLGPRSPKNAARTISYPKSLILAELAGIAYGPVAYFRSRSSS